MPLYPENIARCQHIRVNGTQCGSPALRRQTFCYYHTQWRPQRIEINSNVQQGPATVTLPTLEDANSIQMGLAEVMRLLVARQIDHRTAGLLLYALQTASANLKHTSFEPKQPTQVVIDQESVAQRPLGATAWSAVEGRKYDEVTEEDVAEKSDGEASFDSMLSHLIARAALDPVFRDERTENALVRQKEIAAT
jgi:hypothetical protein